MGVWPFIRRKLPHISFKLVARPESASPAVGLMEKHKQGLDKLIQTIFTQKEIAV